MSLISLLWPSEGYPLVRRDWIFSQLSVPSIPLRGPTAGFQIGLSTLTYDSFSSTQASFFFDAKALEVGAKTSGRLFGNFGVGRTEAANKLSNWDQTFSLEIARRYLSNDGRYGRVGIEYDHFAPSDDRFLHFALDTGILESDEEDWILKLQFHYFHPLVRSVNTRLLAGLDLGLIATRWSTTVLKAGLGFGWTYHLVPESKLSAVQATSDNKITSEHMFFTWTPWVEYGSRRFITRAGIPLRLFVDKEWEARTLNGGNPLGTLVVSYPFEFASPDLWASLTFLL